jgi:hypothetical protein
MALLHGLSLLRGFVFDGNDVQACNSDAAIVIEPDNDPISIRINIGVVRARNVIAISTAGKDVKWLEYPCR